MAISSITSYADGDPGSPALFNSKLGPLVDYVSSLSNSLAATRVGVYSNGSNLGSFISLNFSGSTITNVSGGIATVPLGGSGSGSTLSIQNAGVDIGQAGTFNVTGLGYSLSVVTGVSTLTLAGTDRVTTTLQTSALTTNQSELSAFTAFALGVPVSVQASGKCRVRLYGTANERSLDSSRNSVTDPTTPVLFEASFDTVLGFNVNPPPILLNKDNPRSNLIYYNVTQYENTSGGASGAIASDAFGSSPTNSALSTHTVTNPGSTGWVKWEYNGSSISRYRIDAAGGCMPEVGVADAVIARSDVDLSNTSVEIYIDAYRRAIEGNSDFCDICFCVPNTSLTTWTNSDYLRVSLGWQSTNTVQLSIYQISSAGTISTLSSVQNIAMPLSTALRFGVRVSGNNIRTYTADTGTGANEVSRCSSLMPSGFTDTNHQRVGIYQKQTLGSTGIQATTYVVSSSGQSGAVACAVAFTSERVGVA